jgi:hypothetical protein
MFNLDALPFGPSVVNMAPLARAKSIKASAAQHPRLLSASSAHAQPRFCILILSILQPKTATDLSI